MKPYREMSKQELASLKEQLEALYKEYQGKNLSLNMARGKPCKEQLDLSLPMMDVLNSSSDYMTSDGDVRNYGVLTGDPGGERAHGCDDGLAGREYRDVRKRESDTDVRYREPFLDARGMRKYAVVQT